MNPGQRRPEVNTDLVNERIRFPEVLVIGPDGASLGKMSSRAANDIASRYELDLLCVAPSATPPVCKILNYGKYRFETQKRLKESRKNQKIIEIKEVQLTPQIGIHDLMVKVKGAIGFLQDGDKVKVGVRFRGRQLAHPEVGEEVLNKFISLVEDYAIVEKEGSLEGRWMTAILASKIKK
ncbi:MAG: translation initiation factor IF-3 [Methanomicrobia archaeon]|nr:translation initiation factor IF-3 [Methanomicrobia archaeon]